MDELAQRAELLARALIAPLLVGGPVHLQRPFGARLALALGDGRRVVDNDLRTTIDNGRLRVARSLVPVDVLPELGPAEWALAAGLNDLLQATNHELSSFATRSRHEELLDAVADLTVHIPLCPDLEEAVARHATFSRTLALTRVDTTVSWWTGSQSFRGQQPPSRLLAWPGLRRVRTNEHHVELVNMAAGSPLTADRYEDVLGRWLACSPLTDLANASRPSPPFVWSPHTLAVVQSVAGRNLALRAFARTTQLDDTAVARALAAMSQSAAHLEPAAQAVARRFADELASCDAHWNKEESA